MDKNLVLKILLSVLLFPLPGNSQKINMDDIYGYYIGISLSDIKNQYEIKHYMLLVLETDFYAINFNQLGDKKMMAYSDDIIGPIWDYRCSIALFPDNQIQIQSNTFYFTLKKIDSLTLKIESSTYIQYIDDTLYRVSAKRYKGDFLDNGWSYLPYNNPNTGEEIYVLNYYLSYPETPIWNYYNLETNVRNYKADSFYLHPLTKKIRNKLKE